MLIDMKQMESYANIFIKTSAFAVDLALVE